MVRKSIAPALIIAALVLASAAVTVGAQDNSNYPSIVQKLAEKFNLSESDIQGVFDEERETRRQGMLKMKEEKLNTAVEDGVINESQKKAILDKWQELQVKREKERLELQKWLDEQGIDETKLIPYMGFGHQGRFGKWGMGMMH